MFLSEHFLFYYFRAKSGEAAFEGSGRGGGGGGEIGGDDSEDDDVPIIPDLEEYKKNHLKAKESNESHHSVLKKRTSAQIGAWKCNFPAFSRRLKPTNGPTEQETDRSTNQQTVERAYWEVTLPITVRTDGRTDGQSIL